MSTLRLVISDLRVAFPKRGEVLKGISLTLDSGKLVVITGPSGCGKTTLLRVISTVIPKIFKALVEGVITPNPQQILQSTLYVPQEPWYSIVTPYVWSEITSFCEVQVEEALKVLSRYGLSGMERRTTYTLSAGELQRLSLAVAEVSGKKLVLLDEPTSHLDWENALKVVSGVRSLKSRGASVLVIDHDLSKWWGVLDEAYLLWNGKLSPLSRYEDPYAEWRDKLRGLSKSAPSEQVVCEVNIRKYAPPGARDPLLKDLSFSVRKGEIVLIKGPSGCGKTTLLNLIASRGMHRGVKVKVYGKVFFIPDNPLLYFSEPTPAEEVSNHALLNSFGVSHVKDLPIMMVSTGERRRVAIASALARGADLIILDEPTVGLDPIAKYAVLKAVVEASSRGASFIIASHDGDIELIADEVIRLG